MMRADRHRSKRRIAGFASGCEGMAATEFALVFPALVLLFFGVVESADALSANRRAALAANTLADLVSQESKILESAVDDLFEGVEQIVEADGAATTIRLVSVIADDEGDPVIHWSRDDSGGEPYAAGAAYADLPDAALLDANSSIIVSEISYAYQSKLTQHFISSLTIKKLATRWPRRSFRVQLCEAPGDCTS